MSANRSQFLFLARGSSASNLAGDVREWVYSKAKARSVDRAFLSASTGLALCFVQFFQAVSTTFGNTFGVGAFVGLFSTAFNQAFLFQAITATFSNATAGLRGAC